MGTGIKYIFEFIGKGIKYVGKCGKTVANYVYKGVARTGRAVTSASSKVAKTVTRAIPKVSKTAERAAVETGTRQAASSSSRALVRTGTRELSTHVVEPLASTVAKTPAGRKFVRFLTRFGLSWTPWLAYKCWDWLSQRSHLKVENISTIFEDLASATSVAQVMSALGVSTEPRAVPTDEPLPDDSVVEDIVNDALPDLPNPEGVRERRFASPSGERNYQAVKEALMIVKEQLSYVTINMRSEDDGVVASYETRRTAAHLLTAFAAMTAILNANYYPIDERDVIVAKTFGDYFGLEISDLSGNRASDELTGLMMKALDFDVPWYSGPNESNLISFGEIVRAGALGSGIASLNY